MLKADGRSLSRAAWQHFDNSFELLCRQHNLIIAIDKVVQIDNAEHLHHEWSPAPSCCTSVCSFMIWRYG